MELIGQRTPNLVLHSCGGGVFTIPYGNDLVKGVAILRVSLLLQICPLKYRYTLSKASEAITKEPLSATPGLNHIILTVSNTERSRAFCGDLLGFPVTIIEEDPDKSFFFTCGGVQFFFFPSRQPTPNDRFSEFRIGLDHLSFSAPSMEALQELADKLTAAGVDTKGVEQFIHTGNWYVSFRDPDNIQLEYWLP